MTGAAHISCIKYRNLKNISHYHSDYELVYVNEGNATVSINENIFNLKANQCVFICSKDIHFIVSDEDTVITVLKIGYKYFENIFGVKSLQSPLISDGAGIAGALEAIYSELTVLSENNEVMADCIAAQLLITLFRNEKTADGNGQILYKSRPQMLYDEICRKISKEYNTVTFSEVARSLHFSEPYFSKLFHNIFGMTFTQYLNTVKIAVAIERIKENKMSITEISASCGFNTIRNFNRVFKKFTGYTPNSLPSNYVFMYSLQNGYALDPTLNCTVILGGK